MTKRKLESRLKQLRALSDRLNGDISSLEDQARTPTGGQSVGNLSNAPMHLGDVGTEVYLQELNATLLENEEFLRAEVLAAMERIDDGTYGVCENCGKKIIEERLDLIPYARFCTPCAEKLQSGRDINLNEGRPRDPADAYSPQIGRAIEDIAGADPTSQDVGIQTDEVSDASRRKTRVNHAAGTAGGGTAEGGLAGTNIGDGDPNNADLEGAMGSSTHDIAIERDDEDTIPYSGASGGAVGGTPAGKRAVGGKKRRGGIVPSEDPDRAESG